MRFESVKQIMKDKVDFSDSIAGKERKYESSMSLCEHNLAYSMLYIGQPKTVGSGCYV
jgi:CO dehydrogenase nickel-insertion accessory protein CooC1